MPVHELRVAVTATDYDEALVFYRDVLGLPEREAFTSEDGRVTILEAGRATLELLDPTHAAFVDEVEVGRRVGGHVRIAFEVDDSTATTRALEAAGATVVAEPTRTPWDSMNARLEGPAAAGINTVVWSMRQGEGRGGGPGRGTGRGGGGARGGANLDQLAPIGDYTVTLTAGTTTLKQNARIAKTQGWALGTSPQVIR